MNKKVIPFETKKKYAVLALKWCKENFGLNDLKRTKLKLEVTERRRTHKKAEVYGNYCFYRNKMTIHTFACEDLYDIASTVIHEYTHYLQSRNQYKYYEQYYYYSNNPCEREAKRNEEKYTEICIKDIKKQL